MSPPKKVLQLKSSALKSSHGFFGRTGGVSPTPYDSLNAAYYVSDDAEEHVTENRKRICNQLGLQAALITVNQVHGVNVVEATGDSLFHIEADAIVCKTPGVPIGILTADCVPILLEDAENKIIAACHAGWRGALDGVVQNTIKKMLEIGAKIENIVATIGPCIHQENYEVDEKFYEIFVQKSDKNKRFFIKNASEKYRFDIGKFVEEKLHETGIKTAEVIQEDTFKNEESFFSCRRSFKRGESEFGRQASVICL